MLASLGNVCNCQPSWDVLVLSMVISNTRTYFINSLGHISRISREKEMIKQLLRGEGVPVFARSNATVVHFPDSTNNAALRTALVPDVQENEMMCQITFPNIPFPTSVHVSSHT